MERTNDNQGGSIESRDVAGLVLFNRSAHFAYVYKKTEKLVAAVYMVTSLMPEGEPLRARIRENALSLMSVTIDWNTVTASERKSLLKEYQALSLEIVSLASIARHAGLVSDMNFEVLKREFENLMFAAERDEHGRGAGDSIVLDPSFFDAGKSAGQAPQAQAPSASASVRNDVLYTQPSINKGHDASSAERKTEYLSPVSKDIAPKPRKAIESKDDRQAIIMRLLSKKGGLSVKDFVGAIKGVSEKTIQRELLSMVAAGTLKKEGERRWSTYSLA
jgi:hypothetical protein